ncbi:MAG: imidazole glycerol phosphate synthase subunit HisH [Parvibaculales bacterium]
MSIAIIDYGSGNLRSAEKAFARVAAGLSGDRKVIVTAAPEQVLKADHIVLPGVGAFGDCAEGLRAIDGMEEALNQRVRQQAYPFLGICVGMQLICATGHERGTHRGFGWVDGAVEPLDVPSTLKVPHMGWNDLHITTDHPVFAGLHGQDAYFVHGYAARPSAQHVIAATTDYGGPVVAGLACDTICGTQFHPEKSQQTGLRLIANFLEWKP